MEKSFDNINESLRNTNESLRNIKIMLQNIITKLDSGAIKPASFGSAHGEVLQIRNNTTIINDQEIHDLGDLNNLGEDKIVGDKNKISITNNKRREGIQKMFQGATTQDQEFNDLGKLSGVAEADEFEDKIGEPEGICKPIIAMMYQGADSDVGATMDEYDFFAGVGRGSSPKIKDDIQDTPGHKFGDEEHRKKVKMKDSGSAPFHLGSPRQQNLHQNLGFDYHGDEFQRQKLENFWRKEEMVDAQKLFDEMPEKNKIQDLGSLWIFCYIGFQVIKSSPHVAIVRLLGQLVEFSGSAKQFTGQNPWSLVKLSQLGKLDLSEKELTGGYHGGEPEFGVLGDSKSFFTSEELVKITNEFSKENFIGKGGFGCVHKWSSPDGQVVTVKQLQASSGQKEREFKANVKIISRVHHRHLVALVGYGVSKKYILLIYEFVPYNNLEHHLYGKGRPMLEWTTRVKIAFGVAVFAFEGEGMILPLESETGDKDKFGKVLGWCMVETNFLRKEEMADARKLFDEMSEDAEDDEDEEDDKEEKNDLWGGKKNQYYYDDNRDFKLQLTDDAKRRGDAFAHAFSAHLARLMEEPAAYGKFGLANLLELREECLKEFQFHDAYRSIMQRENEALLAVLPDLLVEIDSMSEETRLFMLIWGVLAANIFDWGSRACVALYHKGTIIEVYRTSRNKMERPWRLDDFDAHNGRMLGSGENKHHPHKRALLFVDNSGADILLWMLSLAMELLKRGTEAVLVANSLYVLNDITVMELLVIEAAAAKHCDILHKAAEAEGSLVDAMINTSDGSKENSPLVPLMVVENGCGSPCIDLRPVTFELAADAKYANNDLAGVEYVEDIYKFYKLVENESRPSNYIHTQSEITKKMRAVLVVLKKKFVEFFGNLYPSTSCQLRQEQISAAQETLGNWGKYPLQFL